MTKKDNGNKDQILNFLTEDGHFQWANLEIDLLLRQGCNSNWWNCSFGTSLLAEFQTLVVGWQGVEIV